MRVAPRRADGGVLCGPATSSWSAPPACVAGAGRRPLLKGVCVTCQLRDRIDELATSADPQSAVLLAPFLRDLAGAENPRSTLRWFYTPGFDVTRRLLAGEIPVTHHGLDEAAVAAPNPVKFVRATLVAAGVLEPRDEHSARFAGWHAKAVLQIAPGTDRAHVRAYATWQVAHQLARTVQRRGEGHRVLAEVRTVARHPSDRPRALAPHPKTPARGPTPRPRRSVDRRRLRGASPRPSVPGVARALARHKLPYRRVGRSPPDARCDRRRAALRDPTPTLHDEDVDLRDRFVGSALLLYGKPITTIAKLRTTDLNSTSDGTVTLRLGRGETRLPEPLGTIGFVLRDRQLRRAETEGWLFPGRHAGQHMSADTLLVRLKRYGVDRSREGATPRCSLWPPGSRRRASPSGSGSIAPAPPLGSGLPA
jgi:hypothetical protein